MPVSYCKVETQGCHPFSLPASVNAYLSLFLQKAREEYDFFCPMGLVFCSVCFLHQLIVVSQKQVGAVGAAYPHRWQFPNGQHSFHHPWVAHGNTTEGTPSPTFSQGKGRNCNSADFSVRQRPQTSIRQ